MHSCGELDRVQDTVDDKAKESTDNRPVDSNELKVASDLEFDAA